VKLFTQSAESSSEASDKLHHWWFMNS